MTSQHRIPPGVPLGKKSDREKKRFGHAVHKAGTQTEAVHAAAENGPADVKRSAHKAPSTLPKKGGQ